MRNYNNYNFCYNLGRCEKCECRDEGNVSTHLTSCIEAAAQEYFRGRNIVFDGCSYRDGGSKQEERSGKRLDS